MAVCNTMPQLGPGQMFENRFSILKKLGEGGFGGVYLVTDTTDGRTHALKIEGANEKIQLLKMEVVVMETLVSKGANRHFADIIDKGRTPHCNYIVMTLLGKSLDNLVKVLPGNKFSISTVIRLGIWCLEALQDMHSIGFLHRDVKPANFAIGRAEVNELRKLYVLDFGMCRSYISPRTGQHITPRAMAYFRGTVRYAPINCHLFKELSRRDDCEVWFYQQVELTCGRLPWAHIGPEPDVGRCKMRCAQDANIGELIGQCPPFYKELIDTVRALQYYDEPPYERLYQMMRDYCGRKGFRQEDPFDWEPGAPRPM